MKIANNKQLHDEIKSLIDTNNININVADMLNLAFSYTDLFPKEELYQYFKEGFTDKEAIVDMLYDFYKLDRHNEENNAIMDEFFLERIERLSTLDYQNNLYVKTIKDEGRYGKYALKYITYEPYQLFPSDEIAIGEHYQEYSRVGFFSEPFSYLALTEGNNIWMSINPNEIATMSPFINKAHGNVLVLGLGMGYVPFMMANKKEVKSITVIEKDQEIINLFNKLIYPKFINGQKIQIIKYDAISYVHHNQKYDYIFADLWHSPEDGLPLFIRLKRINPKIDCWLETSLIALLRRCMLTLIEETLSGFAEDDYRFARTATDRVINDYYKKTKNIVLNDVNDLHNLISDKTLLELAIN